MSTEHRIQVLPVTYRGGTHRFHALTLFYVACSCGFVTDPNDEMRASTDARLHLRGKI